MKETDEKPTGLPENAFRPLKPGEQYHPLMSPDKNYPEVNAWSVTWGIAMAILFSAAAAYLGLKVGQVFEAAIPIAIIAVGVSGAAKRKSALGENVIIQSIGACSGVIVAGAIFTLPALYILQDKYPEMTVDFFQMFISSLLGGILGILFLIPFRKYFVSEKHGEYPFPEATASTQVLISGEKGGSQAKPLLFAGLIGGLYDFIVATFGWWNENFTTRVCGWGETIADKAKLVLKINTGAAVLGLGYIVGLKYAAIICAGSLAVWIVIVPGIAMLWGDQVLNAWNPAITQTVGSMSPETIFAEYAKSIGIGGIAMAGIRQRDERQEGRRRRGAHTERLVDENHRHRVDCHHYPCGVVLLFRCDARQFAAHHCSNHPRGRHLVPVYHGSRQCHCHRGYQSRIGHDTDDPDSGIGGDGCRRAERCYGHGCGIGYGRRGMYRPLDGRRLHYRPENRLLAGKHARQATDVEIPGHTGIGCYRRRHWYRLLP